MTSYIYSFYTNYTGRSNSNFDSTGTNRNQIMRVARPERNPSKMRHTR